VKDMSQMFYSCPSTSLDLSSFNTSKVWNMKEMFCCCASTSLTIGNFDMSQVTATDDMFLGCDNLSTLTMTSLPYLLNGTFNTLFSGEGKTVKVVLDDNSVVYEPYYGENDWVNSNYPEPTVAPTYTRTIAAASQWGTVVLPFRAAAENDDVQLYFLDVVTFNEEGEGSMEFIKEKNSVYPNTPGVFKKKNANATTVTFTGAKDTETGKYAVGAIEDPYDDRGSYGSDYWYIHGTYSKKTDVVQEGKNSPTKYTTYFIAENQFWWAENEITVAPFRAWFWHYYDAGDDEPADEPIVEEPEVKSFNIVVGDETDGINEIVNGKLSNGKLSNGKYMENGRIVILKNGKKYNVNGQVIR